MNALRTIRRTLRAATVYVIGDPGRRRAARDRLAIAQLGDSMCRHVDDVITAGLATPLRLPGVPLHPLAHQVHATGRGDVHAAVLDLVANEDTGTILVARPHRGQR